MNIYEYEVHVGFDDRDLANCARKAYFDFMDDYHAFGFGHESGRKRGTSTLLFFSRERLTKKDLGAKLKDIPIISLKRRRHSVAV